MIYLTKEQFKDIIEHAKKEYPKEACGILAGKIVHAPQNTDHGPRSTVHGLEVKIVERVYKMQNVSEKPEVCYFMDPKEQLKVFKEIRQLGIEMLGIYHSHTNAPAYPSARDCEMAFYPEADYVIISLKDFNNLEVGAFKITEGNIKEEQIIVRKNILFVCIENSCRSQIAEAIVNNFYWQKFVAYSAGSKPSGIVNPLAIEVMKEIGIDISNQKSKGFDEVKGIEFDYVVTLGCGDVCPFYPAKKKFDLNIPDPKDKPIEFFRKVRDEIKNKIDEMIKEVEKDEVV